MAFSFSRTKNRAKEFVLTRTYSFDRLSLYLRQVILFVYRFSSFHLNPFGAHVCYFVCLSLFGSLLLMVIKPTDPSFSPRYVDMLFMSTSVSTVSGLNTVETELLSSGQIFVLSLLMLLSGDVFVNLLGLMLHKPKQSKPEVKVESLNIELEPVDHVSHNTADRIEPEIADIESSNDNNPVSDAKDITANCIRYLRYVVLGYLTTFHVFGVSLLLIYFHRVPSARGVLNRKGINVFLFCLSTTISSFANGGLIATAENMAIFNRDPVVLLLMIAQVVAGNTLFPLFIRLVIGFLKKITKREEFSEMIKSTSEKRFAPLRPRVTTKYLTLTVLALMAGLVVLFCTLDWNRPVFDGLTSFEKFVTALFIAANSRHAGENSIDCSLISPAVLVFLLVMMYLPTSASFWPIRHQEETSSDKQEKKKKKKKTLWVEHVILSQLSYIVIFIILVCITERKQMYRDPLNFSATRMIFEVTSAYGNVGLSTGYSCATLRKLQPDAICKDRAVSLAGWWSDGGKLILAIVMLYGRLKTFSAGGGKAWRIY
ncbi:cation transporter HKT2-like [Canna indica]|uniref:Cation transporter HKT2-like n=1 Tax=Canna indica TaxID=4628 RepID=A0AAQ3JLG3_9LILI|nr:cation transporter HKT2-like [Canna indica]